MRGIKIGGRLAIIYSREDLSAGLVGEPVEESPAIARLGNRTDDGHYFVPGRKTVRGGADENPTRHTTDFDKGFGLKSSVFGNPVILLN